MNNYYKTLRDTPTLRLKGMEKNHRESAERLRERARQEDRVADEYLGEMNYRMNPELPTMWNQILTVRKLLEDKTLSKTRRNQLQRAHDTGEKAFWKMMRLPETP